jgi:hypothetical protein
LSFRPPPRCRSRFACSVGGPRGCEAPCVWRLSFGGRGRAIG